MKRNILRIGAAGMALLFAATSPLPAAHLTGLTLFGVGFERNELVSVNPATGAATVVGSFGDTIFATGLGVRDGRLFVFDQVNDRIREINKISGELISSIDIGVGNVTGEGALAFRSDGVGFLASPLNAQSQPVNDFYMFTIEPNASTGASVRIGSTGMAIDAMAFNSQGALYALAQGDRTLYTIDPATGAATAVGPLAGIDMNSPIAGMTVAPVNPDGVEEIYASIDDILYIINPVTVAARRASADVLNFGPFISSVSGLAFSPGAATLGNISTRAAVGTGENVSIGGFIVRGTPDKRVILRGIGPSIPGMQGTLADPVLELFNSQGASIARNDNWRDSQESEIRDSGLAPSNDKESAIIRTLADGPYTAVLSGAGGTSGVGLVEIYDLALGSASRLANLSTRGLIQTGNNVLIGGVIIAGSKAQRVVFRAIGPTLTSSAIQNPLQDPTLEIHDANGQQVAFNNNFRDDPRASEVETAGLNPGDNRESAILLDLAPAAYTAVMRGAGDTSGVGVVETYNLSANAP